jgi:hypothetical protein
MPSQEDIESQYNLLRTHRQTLSLYLKQLAMHGEAYAPPSILNGIIEARKEILLIKNTLRTWNCDVEDIPSDTGNDLIGSNTTLLISRDTRNQESKTIEVNVHDTIKMGGEISIRSDNDSIKNLTNDTNTYGEAIDGSDPSIDNATVKDYATTEQSNSTISNSATIPSKESVFEITKDTDNVHPKTLISRTIDFIGGLMVLVFDMLTNRSKTSFILWLMILLSCIIVNTAIDNVPDEVEGVVVRTYFAERSIPVMPSYGAFDTIKVPRVELRYDDGKTRGLDVDINSLKTLIIGRRYRFTLRGERIVHFEELHE